MKKWLKAGSQQGKGGNKSNQLTTNFLEQVTARLIKQFAQFAKRKLQTHQAKQQVRTLYTVTAIASLGYIVDVQVYLRLISQSSLNLKIHTSVLIAISKQLQRNWPNQKFNQNIWLTGLNALNLNRHRPHLPHPLSRSIPTIIQFHQIRPQVYPRRPIPRPERQLANQRPLLLFSRHLNSTLWSTVSKNVQKAHTFLKDNLKIPKMQQTFSKPSAHKYPINPYGTPSGQANSEKKQFDQFW